ncbi:MAG: hypothetical protein JNL67_01465 [Planctomycetaceae bacterium]|nr:hypothetical protein [Planctomycetaceae bacterium]
MTRRLFAEITLVAALACILPQLSWPIGASSQQVERHDVRQNKSYDAVTWVQASAEYQLLVKQIYRGAAIQLLAGLEDRQWSADEIQTVEGNFQNKPPAIILDVDETVLDNSAYNARNIRDNQSFSLDAWNAWCEERRALAIPGAVDFIHRAEALGVKVFFITDREDNVRQATIENLKQIGVNATEENVLTKNPQLDDKISRRAIVTQNHRVLLLIGDSMSDLCSGMGTREWEERQAIAAEKTELFGPRWVMLPNPVYGSWQRALPKDNNGLRLN